MRQSTPRVQQKRSIVGKIVLALVFASLTIGVSMGPALGADRGWRERQPARARRAHHPPRRAYRSYGYYAPPRVIYAPPPVVYAPPPSPGISLFFELPFRHR